MVLYYRTSMDSLKLTLSLSLYHPPYRSSAHNTGRLNKRSFVNTTTSLLRCCRSQSVARTPRGSSLSPILAPMRREPSGSINI